MIKKLSTAVLLITAVVMMLSTLPAHAGDKISYTRIAVMPFKNLTGNKDKSWLGEGIADTLTTQLGTIKSLILIERADLQKAIDEIALYQSGLVEEEKDARIGKLVAANYMIIGSYQLAAGEILINIRLMEVKTSKVKETAKVRGKFEKIFDLQDQAAEKTLAWLKIASRPDEIKRMKAAPNRDINALELLSKARMAFALGRTDDAEKYIDKLLELDPVNPDALIEKGRIQGRKGEYQAALANYTTASNIFRKNNDDKNYALTLNNIGLVHKSQGRYEKALKYYEQSLEIKRRIGNEPGIAETLNNIGSVHYSQGRYEKALKYYEQSLEISRKIGDEPTVAVTLNNIGLVHYSQGRYEKALKYYEQSLEIKRRIGNEPGIAKTLNNIGAVHKSQGRYEKALKYYEQSLEISRKIGDEPTVAITLNNIGVVYDSQGRYREARKAWEESLIHYRNIGDYKKVKVLKEWLNELPN